MMNNFETERREQLAELGDARRALLKAALPAMLLAHRLAAEGDEEAAEVVAAWDAAWDRWTCAAIAARTWKTEVEQ